MDSAAQRRLGAISSHLRPSSNGADPQSQLVPSATAGEFAIGNSNFASKMVDDEGYPSSSDEGDCCFSDGDDDVVEETVLLDLEGGAEEDCHWSVSSVRLGFSFFTINCRLRQRSRSSDPWAASAIAPTSSSAPSAADSSLPTPAPPTTGPSTASSSTPPSPPPLLPRPNRQPRPANPNLKSPESSTLRRSTGSIKCSEPSTSPSPNPSRSRNPNPKTPDSSGVRRSTGSLKPSVTAEPRGNSGYKASRDLLPSLRATEQNENEREPSFPKSPAVKGVKSFMAPTISASSKAIAALSARKKILGERNEVSSVSDSLDHGVEESGKKSGLSSGFWDVLGSPDSRKPEPDTHAYTNSASLKFTPTPLDADPSSLPYDPKTNYLAPRPQFLYYKPSPRLDKYRVEREFLDGGEGRQLEDSFSSGSSEETDESTQEAISDLQEKESENEDEQKGEEAEEVVDTVSPVPNGNKLKPWSFTWLKALPLLFIMVIVCFFAPLSDFPVLSSTRSSIVENFNVAASRFRDWSANYVAYVPIEVGSYDLVNLTFQSVDQSVESYPPIFRTKSQNHLKVETQMGDAISVSTEEEIQDLEIGIEDVSEVLDIVDEDEDFYMKNDLEDVGGTFKVVHEFDGEEAGPLEQDISEVLDVVDEDDDSAEFYMENDLEDVSGTFKVVHEYEGEEAGSLEQDVSLASDVVSSAKFDMENDVKDVGSVYEYNGEEVLESENEADCVKELEGGESSSSYEDKEEIMVEELDEVEYNSVDEVIKEETEIDEDSVIELEERILSSQDDTTTTMHEVFEEQAGSGDSLLLSTLYSDFVSVSRKSLLGLSVAAIVLATSIVVVYVKRKQTNVIGEKAVSPKGEAASVSGSSDNFDAANKLPDQKDLIGDSDTLEASSNLHTTPYSGQERAKGVDSLSNDRRRRRRDSTETSTISYGSYTTLEKIALKKGYRDEEVVTPVRRSSRIRSHVSSP